MQNSRSFNGNQPIRYVSNFYQNVTKLYNLLPCTIAHCNWRRHCIESHMVNDEWWHYIYKIIKMQSVRLEHSSSVISPMNFKQESTTMEKAEGNFRAWNHFVLLIIGGCWFLLHTLCTHKYLFILVMLKFVDWI